MEIVGRSPGFSVIAPKSLSKNADSPTARRRYSPASTAMTPDDSALPKDRSPEKRTMGNGEPENSTVSPLEPAGAVGGLAIDAGVRGRSAGRGPTAGGGV